MALAGNELLEVTGITGTGLPSGQTFVTNTAAIAALAGNVSSTQVITTLSTVGAGTITAAGIIGKYVARTGAQVSAAFTDTTATANAITALLPSGAAVGTSFPFTYTNLTNAPATIAAGSGVTVSNITVVPPNSFAKWLVTYSATSTYTFVGVEQGYLPHGGTVTVTGATAVVVADTNVTTFSQISFTLRSVGGTVGAIPKITAMIPGVSFSVVAITADISVYNYNILG